MNPLAEKYFKGRKLLFATMHGKENGVRPLLEPALGVHVITPENLNTDRFGTFSGEVERKLSPLETAILKCEEAARLTGETLVLASEGSFGAHPVMGFVPANEEILVLKDFKYGWEFRAKVLSTETNFAGNEYDNLADAKVFLTQVGFPAHAVILRKSKGEAKEIHKGISNWMVFRKTFTILLEQYGRVFVETDMRAHLNPSRQKVIIEACEKLLSVVLHPCPVCEAPGFAISEVVSGLPCSRCEAPTRTAKAFRYRCQHCGYRKEKLTLEKRKKADPLFCDECNP